MAHASSNSWLIYNVKKVVVPLISILVFVEDIFVLLLCQLYITHFIPKDTPRFQNALDQTKKAFICILITIWHVVAPSKVRITTDNKTIPKGTFFIDLKKNKFSSNIKPNSVTIANHQIYTDWVFLWWLAYTSNLAGRVYIMLKKSLQSIPVLGYGMTNFKFIFMNRKWAADRVHLINSLRELDADARGTGSLTGSRPVSVDDNGLINWNTTIQPSAEIKQSKKGTSCWPYNLILFPEGTNHTANTLSKSIIFAEKANRKPLKNVLLPHSTGLRFCLRNLKPSLDILYDVTIAYSGIDKETKFAADAYGLGSIFLEGKYPSIVDIYIRAFEIENIPIDDEDQFVDWIYNVWKEKDELLENYHKNGNSFGLDPELNYSTMDGFSVSNWEFFLVLAFPLASTLFLLKYILSLLF
ncbi:hypothetical protein KAFR_0C00610 [Kazachstania africana CBS 2517]|uniref:Phospholipid/glycerol acyltransferase domain-containing protein n=1 Tax=Kazachstania africana (strain ATCC 22294 / BCRC 22015 / CBS 2517 / CECT 1963 / NBRC 1671 / NRRL Y-8276) TaxID=1071382 RepID=H2ARQ6_KAZAF|nr:hypothetical protein KAFR_0C00610 [Kazachstania africana CBS 2517]CCF57056.1 hypothetical protein KAFR_0C00610 [Kazachstania africana CBS 2517]